MARPLFPSPRPRSNIILVALRSLPLLMLVLLPVSLAFSSSSNKLLIHRCRSRSSAAARFSLIHNRGELSTPPINCLRGRSCYLRPSYNSHHHSVFSKYPAISSFSTIRAMSTSVNDPSVVQKSNTTTTMDEDPTVDKVMDSEEEEEEEEDGVDEEELLQNSEEDATTTIDDIYPKGIPGTNSIIHHATIPHPAGFSQSQISSTFSPQDIERLKLRPDNVTVPVALLLLFPDRFGSQTNARKASRTRKILVHRGPLLQGEDEENKRKKFDRERLMLGKVGDRVKPGDTLAIQTRMSHNYSECKNHHSAPPFHLPIVYQDDHCAVVNKPEGIVVFSHKNGGFGRNNVKSCLPWVLEPPRAGVVSVMRRPNPVHRIDRGTSGLLVVAKTKPAMSGLAMMFRERKVKKTYTAIVNGNILEPKETSITSDEAKKMGVCIGDEEEVSWQLIDDKIEDQSAVTIWRPLRRWPLENARNDTVSLVELKPKTGRYHQLRRHMAWVSNCPLLGDKSYDGGGLAKTLRDQGFYLCSNKVTLEHPYYNTRTPERKKEWNANKETVLKGIEGLDGNARITEEEDGTILVHCEIDLPAKFREAEGETLRGKIK